MKNMLNTTADTAGTFEAEFKALRENQDQRLAEDNRRVRAFTAQLNDDIAAPQALRTQRMAEQKRLSDDLVAEINDELAALYKKHGR